MVYFCVMDKGRAIFLNQEQIDKLYHMEGLDTSVIKPYFLFPNEDIMRCLYKSLKSSEITTIQFLSYLSNRCKPTSYLYDLHLCLKYGVVTAVEVDNMENPIHENFDILSIF